MNKENSPAAIASAAPSSLTGALVQIARDIEGMKRECGMDPESPTAIYNSRLMGIAFRVRALASAAAAPSAPDSAAPSSLSADWDNRDTKTAAGWINELLTLAEHRNAALPTWARGAIRTIAHGLNETVTPPAQAPAIPREAPSSLTDEQINALWIECSQPTEANDHTTGPLPFARALLALTTPAQAPAIQAPEAVGHNDTAIYGALTDRERARTSRENIEDVVAALGRLAPSAAVPAIQAPEVVAWFDVNDKSVPARWQAERPHGPHVWRPLCDATPSAAVSAGPDPDGERYRWLRDRPLDWSIEHHRDGWSRSYGRNELDRAIDAARGAIPAPAPTQPQQGTGSGS